MKIQTYIVTALIIFLASCQTAKLFTVTGKNLVCETNPNKTYGSQVNRTIPESANNDCPCTMIIYQSVEYLIKDAGEKKTEKIKNKAPGGLAQIYVERPTIGAAATDNFSITYTIKGKSRELENPENPENPVEFIDNINNKVYAESKAYRIQEGWATNGYVLLKEDTEKKFQIKLVDSYPKEKCKNYTFEVMK